jgi:site-specific DNA-methyltransferase (adenine-specific)
MKIDKSEVSFYNDDCFNVMSKIPDNSIPLICTDPPYGIGFTGDQSADKTWDNFSDKDYYDFMVKFLTEAKRILTDNGTIWLFCGPTKIPDIFRAIEQAGLHNHLENWLIYCRPKGRGAKTKMKSQREDCLHITKSDTYTWHNIEYLREVIVPYMVDGKPRGWALDQTTGLRVRWTGIGNVSFFTPPFYLNKFEPQIHSCQKPVLLFSELIMMSSDKGETVLDPFAGSAASGIASVICDRNWIGCEQEQEMYNKANNWLNHIKWSEVNDYLKKRVSSSEKGFKFGYEVRKLMPK